MEKNTRSAKNAKSDCPQSPSAASVEKLRRENEKNKDSAKNRNSESHSSKQRPLPESQEIDKQISELACLIQRLQDEIVELSRNATQSPSLVDTSTKEDNKNTQTLKITDKMDHSSKKSGADNHTVIVNTVHNQPSPNVGSGFSSDELPEGIRNVVNIDKASFDDLDSNLMNCSQVASETKPEPKHKPHVVDDNLYDNVYQLNMNSEADEDYNVDQGYRLELVDGNETDDYHDENEHSSEFDFGPDIGDTTVVVENTYDDVNDNESSAETVP